MPYEVGPAPKGYSQFGEHLDIDEVLGDVSHGYAADVGASDGVTRNNTKQLEERGWDVLCIEANTFYGPELYKQRKRVMLVACGAENNEGETFHVFEVAPGNFEAVSSLKPDPERPIHQRDEPVRTLTVPVRTLDWCLEKSGFPRLDVLSIDVEGGEADVLDGCSLDRWKPKVIILEDWYGGKFRDRLAKSGYRFRNRRVVNEVFVRG